MTVRYEIRVRGRLTPALASSFTGMRARVARVTVLRVRLAEGADPAALVDMVARLGMTAVGVRRVLTERHGVTQ